MVKRDFRRGSANAIPSRIQPVKISTASDWCITSPPLGDRVAPTWKAPSGPASSGRERERRGATDPARAAVDQRPFPQASCCSPDEIDVVRKQGHYRDRSHLVPSGQDAGGGAP